MTQYRQTLSANYAFGLLFAPFGHIVVRFLANRFGQESSWQLALDNISGTSLTHARADLDRWNSLQTAVN